VAPLPKLEAHAYTDGASGGSRAQLRLPQLIADGVFDPLLDLTDGNTIKRVTVRGARITSAWDLRARAVIALSSVPTDPPLT
jgi:hypothetical protein